jgi:hypothetical protein
MTTEQNLVNEAVLRPVTFASQSFVHMSFEGSMEQVGGFLSKLQQEFEAQKVPGVDANSRPYVVLHGDPDKTKVLKMDLGFDVSGHPRVKSPLSISSLAFNKVARVTHTGHYSELSGVHQQFLKAAAASAQGSAAANTRGAAAAGAQEGTIILHLLQHSTNPASIQTEMIVPLK